MKKLLLLLFIPTLQTLSVNASAKQPIDTALNQPASERHKGKDDISRRLQR